MKHEDRRDKELSHLISIIKTPDQIQHGVYRLGKHNEQIRDLFFFYFFFLNVLSASNSRFYNISSNRRPGGFEKQQNIDKPKS